MHRTPSVFHISRLALLLPLGLAFAPAFAHPDHGDSIGAGQQLVPVFFQTKPKADEVSTSTPRNEVAITTEGGYRFIRSNGWPDHVPGAFPRRGNPNVPTAQKYSFRVPLKTKELETPAQRGGWWWGVALNGVPFEPGTGETWNNDPRSGWRYEAATGFLNLGLDEHNAHVQPNGSYHYHALPVGVVEKRGGDKDRMLLIGWAADGFPLYTSMAYGDAKDAKSPVRKMKASYRLKAGPRPNVPGGPSGNHDGRFTQDFEFVKGLGDLDECNGRFGVTPEFPEGTYYYCASADFPFVPRLWKGEPDQSFFKNDRPPGGGPGGGPGAGPRDAPPGGAPRGIMEGGPGPSAYPDPSNPQPAASAQARGNTGPGGLPLPPVLTALDANHDGEIDADELSKATQSLKSLDRNGDGQLTPDEYRPAGAAGPRPAATPAPAPAAPETKPAPAPVPAKPTSAPNLLILMADDLGWGDVSYHGGVAPTPNLANLAKAGMELQRFYACPVCSPTRAAFISGQMPRRLGITDVMGPGQTLPEKLETLPGAFKAAGYTTSLIGKWHLGTGRGSVPQSHGFDHFYGFLGPQIDYFKHTNQRDALDWQRDGQNVTEEGYSTDLLADEAIRQIKRRDTAKPFFIQLAFNAPHEPQSAPAELLEKHKALGNRAAGAASVEALDLAIGRVLAALDSEKLAEKTLVVFFSDNGASRRTGSNGELRQGKSTVYEGGIRTPASVRWPGQITPGSVSQLPVAAHDLFPTLAGAAGVKAPATLDGLNLWTQLRDNRSTERPAFAVAMADIALFDSGWKLIETADGQRSLFHVSQDKTESRDELAQQTAVAQKLGEKLEALKKDLPPAVKREAPRPGGGGGQRPGGRPN